MTFQNLAVPIAATVATFVHAIVYIAMCMHY